MKHKEEITKPYRIQLQVDNKPLIEPEPMIWTVITTNSRKSFSFASGTYWQAMHIWRTTCEGADIINMYSKPRADYGDNH